MTDGKSGGGPGHERSFTGRRRQRTTRPSVRVVDRFARIAIMLGGVGTILAVSTVCVFLVWVVVPLFREPGIARAQSFPGKPERGASVPVRTEVDDQGTVSWTAYSDGTLRVRRLDRDAIVEQTAPFADPIPTAWSFASGDGLAVVGYADGTVRLANIGFEVEFLNPEGVPAQAAGTDLGAHVDVAGVVYHRTAENQFRAERVAVALEPPFRLAPSDDGGEEPLAPVVLADVVRRPSGPVVAAFGADARLRVAEVSTKTNLLTGEATVELTGGEVRLPLDPVEGAPRWLELTGLGDNVLLGWPSGRVVRIDTRDPGAMRPVETIDAVPEPGRTMTAFGMLLGETTVLTGDDGGRVRAWFRTRSADGEPSGDDRQRLVAAHDLAPGSSAVRSLTTSARSRTVVAGFEDGSARMYHVTGNRLLVSAAPVPGFGPALSVALSPKDERLVVEGPGGLAVWDVAVPHPEASTATIFRPVWYEGYAAPEHVWQSSSGTDDFEPKYGLTPLVFGTIKATMYSMLFGLPLALLAALYTSEFMHRSTRAKVKPTIELMASLPSVVLGFLSALVIAPVVEQIVPEILAAIVTVPTAFLVGGCLWQFAPQAWAVRHGGLRAAGIAVALVLGIAGAFAVGPSVERALFAGDLRAWLDGQIGSGFGGWVLLTLPLCALVVGWVAVQWVGPGIRERARRSSRSRVAGLELAKFAGGIVAALVLAVVVAGLLTMLGFDPRGGVLGTYVQRNAMVVGFIMGFAIIPIIYTISEDALSSVPEHLRAASLGAGATPWQTAVRVIVPTAMSGLFSAVMIGLGRAVGETMIVLMAAGNTPILDWNVFNGFRTLSANIAVELPEAVKDSTHYRMLFLAALTLFVLTFVLNTVAEIVRQRFRKRAFQL